MPPSTSFLTRATTSMEKYSSVSETETGALRAFADSIAIVDGGAWHRSGSSNPGSDWEYPDFILSGAEVQGVKGGRKQKL